MLYVVRWVRQIRLNNICFCQCKSSFNQSNSHIYITVIYNEFFFWYDIHCSGNCTYTEITLMKIKSWKCHHSIVILLLLWFVSFCIFSQWFVTEIYKMWPALSRWRSRDAQYRIVKFYCHRGLSLSLVIRMLGVKAGWLYCLSFEECRCHIKLFERFIQSMLYINLSIMFIVSCLLHNVWEKKKKKKASFSTEN